MCIRDRPCQSDAGCGPGFHCIYGFCEAHAVRPAQEARSQAAESTSDRGAVDAPARASAAPTIAAKLALAAAEAKQQGV